MRAISDLESLLSSIAPVLVPGRFAFVAVDASCDLNALEPVCVFREVESTSVICALAHADKAGLKAHGVFRQITLQVYSSLEAVGFTAAVASALAAAGIPYNAVSAYHHDHIFVPEEMAERAMEVLMSFERKAERPNKALEPTPPSVTSRADARAAPAGVVAHL